MALFSRKKEETKAPEAEKSEVKKAVGSATYRASDRNLASVLIKPRITEKAVKKGESNIYTFIVRRDATKFDVRDAIKALFNVTPIRVNIVNKSPRQYVSKSKSRTMTEKCMKKAYVYLQAGDSIELA